MDWKGARDNGLTTAKITGEVNFIWVFVPKKKNAVKISNRDTTTCTLEPTTMLSNDPDPNPNPTNPAPYAISTADTHAISTADTHAISTADTHTGSTRVLSTRSSTDDANC